MKVKFNKFKRFFLFSFTFFLFLSVLIPIFEIKAQELEKVQIDVFYSSTCPHCKEAKAFLANLDQQYASNELVINNYNIAEKGSVDLLKQLYPKYNIPNENYGLVPIMFVADKYFLGFNQNTGNTIKNYVDGLIAQCQEVEHQNCEHNQASLNPEKIESEREFNIPFLGKIDISGFSPLILSITVGTLDGFNACAMVALGFLLAVLVATGVRKKIILIGGVFILVSGLVYFLFISAWLNLFMFIGYQKYFQIIVAVIIIFFALAVLKDYFTGVVCKVCNVDPNKQDFFSKLQRKMFVRMSNLSKKEMSLGMTIIGVAIVAAGVNLVELACSFGFPLAYTKILTTYNLPTVQYYGYLLVYVLFYMIDDFLIFLVAVVTLKITKFSDKYLKVIKLISGIVLLILGLLMLFKPELLSF
jgi:thiol-disulfide isomerase/thioredoxin